MSCGGSGGCGGGFGGCGFTSGGGLSRGQNTGNYSETASCQIDGVIAGFVFLFFLLPVLILGGLIAASAETGSTYERSELTHLIE